SDMSGPPDRWGEMDRVRSCAVPGAYEQRRLRSAGSANWPRSRSDEPRRPVLHSPLFAEATIRPAHPTDTEAVGDIFLAALTGMTYLPELYTEAQPRTFIRDVLLPNNEVWVAERDGRVAGFVGLGEDQV